MDISVLFEQFVKEKTFLLNVTPKTLRWYRQSWNAITRNVGTPETLDRFVLNEFVIKLKESGISATSVNAYIRRSLMPRLKPWSTGSPKSGTVGGYTL